MLPLGLKLLMFAVSEYAAKNEVEKQKALSETEKRKRSESEAR